jgi:hypothetical protein
MILPVLPELGDGRHVDVEVNAGSAIVTWANCVGVGGVL